MLLHLVGEDEYAYYFPDASHFDKHWEDSKENPENNYHVQASLRSVFQWIEVAEAFGESPEKKISGLIQDTTADSTALKAAGAAVEWHENDGREAYDNARASIALLDIAYKNAIDRGWNSVSLFCLQAMAALEHRIGSVDTTIIERAADLIEIVINDSDVHLGNLSDSFQILLDNESIFNSQGAAEKRAFLLGIRQANRLHNQGNYFQERSLLATLIELAGLLNIPIDDLESRYVETYRRNANQQAKRSASLEAEELVRALEDQIVLNQLSDDEKKEWKSKLRSAVQSAAYELKREGAVIDSPRQRYLRQSTTQKFVRQFEHINEIFMRHLFYGDETGTPGTSLTFFPYPAEEDGRIGQPQITTAALVVPPGSLEYWTDRLTAHDVEFVGPFERFDETVLRFTDPDGTQLELVTGDSPVKPWQDGSIPSQDAVRGIHV